MSRKKGVEMEIEMAGSILAPTLFVLEPSVALVRVPDTIVIRQRL
jgi:hypothetical protein